MHIRTAIKAILFSASIFLVACGGKVTPDNYSQLEAGMEREAVHKILGTPDEASGSGIGKLEFASETWRSSKYVINVSYANNKVVVKSLEDTKSDQK